MKSFLESCSLTFNRVFESILSSKVSVLTQKIKPDIQTRSVDDHFKCLTTYLKVYLLHCHFFELFLKHILYFFWITYGNTYFDIEYLLVSIYGLIQSHLLIANLLLDKPNNLYVIGIQFVMLNLIALIQFPFGMSIWDHKHRMITRLFPEFVKFIFLDFYIAIVFGYLISQRGFSDIFNFLNQKIRLFK